MSKKADKKKKTPPVPKVNRQISISQVRPLTHAGLDADLMNARQYPIYGCWIMTGWKEQGITPVVVARQKESGRILYANYMIDLYCLGLKNVLVNPDCSLNKFERDLPMMCNNELEACPVELAHEIIYGAIEYAADLGFQPHPDFERLMADQILDPPDAHPRNHQVEFGKDGKPFYISGPYDEEWKISQVLSTLQRTRGTDNYDFLAGFGGMPPIEPDEE
jgi:hypothetical protein